MPTSGESTSEHAIPSLLVRAVKSIPKWGYVLLGVGVALGFGIVTPNERIQSQDSKIGIIGLRLDSVLKVLGAVAMEQARQGDLLDWNVSLTCDRLSMPERRASGSKCIHR